MDPRATFACYTVILMCRSAFGQELAKKKCLEFSKMPRSTSITALGIVGGSLTHTSEFPHMVALGYGHKRNLHWLCGATIISESFVLTAAHCTNHQEHGRAAIARMGVTNLKDHRNAIDREISEILVHPNYRPPSLYDDIALLKLQAPVHFTRSVQPACLNTAFNVTNRLIATGWGQLSFGGYPSDDLMKVDLVVFAHKHCQARYTNVSKRKLPKGIDSSKQICLGGKGKEEKDTCQGDSGGPLFMKTDALYTVVGVTAFGKACGISNVPGVYTRVSYYVPWIEKTVWAI